MRISNHRYSRDRSRYDLAYAMLQLGARPKTVTAWTQLTQYQIRNVADEYPEQLVRHRGRPPKSMAWFWREGRRQQEGAILASFLILLKIVSRGAPREEDYPSRSVSRGMRLCAAYQEYARVIPHPRISFEYALLLFKELGQGDMALLKRCSRCGAATLADPLSAPPHVCASCWATRKSDPTADVAHHAVRSPKRHSTSERNKAEIRQQASLFD
jgi:hypothetical protein